MRRYGLLVLVLVLAGCGKGGAGGGDAQDSSKGAGSKKEQSAGSATQVKIDGRAQERAGIQVADVAPRAVPEYLTASGQIVMNEERTAHIGTYTDGRITQVDANVGDVVHKGMVLARMHSHDVHETRAAYESAQEEVRRKQNALEYQSRMRDRMHRLLDLKSASRQEVEKAETDLRSAETDLANAKISVAKEVAHLTDILSIPESELPNLTETTEQVPVISPINGIVIDRKITTGQVVEPGAEVFTVSDLSSVWMIASVNETDIAKLHAGNRARLLTQAYADQAFDGRVARVGTELNPQTRTLSVRILIPNRGMRLRPAMYANAQIDEGYSRQALFVPEEAVQEINGSSVVFARKGDVFEARAVQIAHRINGEAEISAGLRAGDAVAVKGSFVVKSELLKSQIGE